MDKQQAISILEQAIDAALQKGVYSLKDMNFIIDALEKVSELVELVPSEN